MPDDQKITLISNDGRRFEVPLAVARISAMIADQINDDDNDNAIESEILCPKVSGDILQKVVDTKNNQWKKLKHHYRVKPLKLLSNLSGTFDFAMWIGK
mmetsp:Transcript_3510/g.6647  ORF Transcript_3510/g.6647 Transcript_3510/m.6647 type:complete len:99 (-) Transcript_3510:399-695(-)